MFAVLVAVEWGLQRSADAATWVRGGEGGEGGAHHAGRRGDPHHPTHASPQGQAPAGLFIIYQTIIYTILIFLKKLCASLCNDDLSNEPNFGRIHLAGQYL